MSEAVTRGVRIHVTSRFHPERSTPALGHWFFSYTVEIHNGGDATVQLLSRHWLITDGYGRVHEVRGAGVIGQQPVIEPGESFSYTSACPLPTSLGQMEGSYRMLGPDGEEFDAAIEPFPLVDPSAEN